MAPSSMTLEQVSRSNQQTISSPVKNFPRKILALAEVWVQWVLSVITTVRDNVVKNFQDRSAQTSALQRGAGRVSLRLPSLITLIMHSELQIAGNAEGCCTDNFATVSKLDWKVMAQIYVQRSMLYPDTEQSSYWRLIWQHKQIELQVQRSK